MKLCVVCDDDVVQSVDCIELSLMEHHEAVCGL